MDKHLGVFITLMNSHLHVSLNCAFNMITHHVTHPVHGPQGGGCGYHVVKVLHGWKCKLAKKVITNLCNRRC